MSLIRTLAATATSLIVLLALALPVLAQEGGEHAPISLERKLLAAGILAAALMVMVVWAWLYRRVNRI